MNKNDKTKLKLKKGHIVLKIILIFFVIILIFELAVLGAYIYKSKGNISKAAANIVTDFVGKQEPIICLFLGVSNDTTAILTDTIIIGGYNPSSQKAFLLSVPRDTLVRRTGNKINGSNKINALYQNGIDEIIDAIYELTGLKIDNYVLINNKILIDSVDSIGGVEFDVPIDMNYDDKSQNLHIHLKKGKQLLDGKKAEQLVRFRHNNNGTTYSVKYGDNDYGRMKTQREFIKSFVEKVIQTKDVYVIKVLLSSVFDNLETNIKLKNVFSYIPFIIQFNTNELKMEPIPGKSCLINEIWFFEPDKRETKELVQEMLEYIEYKNY